MSSYRHPLDRPSAADQGARALAADAALDPLADPDRVTVHGDWHGAGGHARRAIREAVKAGSRTQLHTGDLGLWPGRSGQAFLDDLERYLAESDAILIFVDGNHEDFDQLVEYPIAARHGLRCVRPRLYHAPRGHRWTWHGLTWLALGGATTLDTEDRVLGVSWWPQESITWAQAETAIAGGPADVVITHDCPAGVVIPDLPAAGTWAAANLRRADAHRDLLRAVVDEVRPTHLFHGHFHSRYTADLDLGGGLSCAVTGLDRDGTLTKSWVTLDLDRLALDSALRRDGTSAAPDQT